MCELSKKEQVLEEDTLLTIEAFEGVCPECGQPFLARIFKEQEEKIIFAIETIKSLQTIIAIRERAIDQLKFAARTRNIFERKN
jgi:hypothetical protein